MLIAEMLAIHFCSDQNKTLEILSELLALAKRRVANNISIFKHPGVRIFWVNPVADLYAMNLLEKLGGQIAGTDYLFCHALDQIPEKIDPIKALAQMALADPMIGSANDRANRIIHDIKNFSADAVVISKIPGASHCATEGKIISALISEKLKIPAIEIEIPPYASMISSSLETRLSALIEMVK